jgi:hypothetical protein
MTDYLEKLSYKKYTIKIFIDDLAESPREWDNLGKLVIFGKHGVTEISETATNYNPKEYSRWNELDAAVMEDYPECEYVPVYKYEHGGVMFNTTGFPCPWDSGRVGFILATREDVAREYDVTYIAAELKAKVKKLLVEEIRQYSKWVNGEVYGYVIEDEEGCEEDSQWGFEGIDEAIKASKEIIDNLSTKTVCNSDVSGIARPSWDMLTKLEGCYVYDTYLLEIACAFIDSQRLSGKFADYVNDYISEDQRNI